MTGEGPKESSEDSHGRRAAAQAMRQQQASKDRRRRTLLAGGGVLLVLIVIGVLVGVGLTNDKHGGATVATASVSQEATSVPASVFDAVGRGGQSVQTPPVALSAQPLTENGKPKVLFVGAEWCPYCAAQRWVMAVALSRFGTFSNLGQVYSAADDGDIASLSFHGATYTSNYLVFDANEVQDRDHNNLDTLSPADMALFTAAGGGFPFIDIGGKYQVGAMFNPTLLSGMDQQQIASALSDPSNPVTQAIVGSANVLTAKLCTLTDNQPAAVCNSAGVKAAS